MAETMTPNTPTPADTLRAEAQAALTLAEAARAKVQALCDGDERWVMHIPARPDTDPDIVISRGLAVVPDLARQILALIEALEWYADDKNWQNETPGAYEDDPQFFGGKVFVEDIGDTARAALRRAAGLEAE